VAVVKLQGHIHTHTHTHIHTQTHTNTHKHTHTHTNTHIHTNTHKHTHARAHALTHPCMHALACVYRAADVAVVKVDTTDALPVVPIGGTSKLRAGEWVVALGSPLMLKHSVRGRRMCCLACGHTKQRAVGMMACDSSSSLIPVNGHKGLCAQSGTAHKRPPGGAATPR